MHETEFRRLVVAYQHEHQNHSCERNEARHNDNRVESMCGQRLVRIREITNQLGCRIISKPAPVPLKPLTEATELLAKRSDGKTFAIVENDA